MSQTQTPESLVSAAIDPDEEIVWCGRPDADALCAHALTDDGSPLALLRPRRTDGSRLPRVIVPLALTAVLVWPFRESVPVLPILAGIGALVILLSVIGGRLGRNAMRRYADSLTYAITDRRLLILEGDVITDAYGPGDRPLARRKLRPRGAGYTDIVFERVPFNEREHGPAKIWPTAPDPSRVHTASDGWVVLEQATKAFKALPNAETVDRHIRDWIEGHQQEEKATLDDYMAALQRHPASRDGGPSPVRHVENPELGLELDLPEDWEIRVRQRRRPSGVLAVDVQLWEELGEAPQWNTLEAEGTMDIVVSVELVESAELVLKSSSLRGGLLFRLLGGRFLDLGEGERIGAFDGFVLTRRLPTKDKKGPRTLQRYRVLHDGRRQLVIVTQWREEEDAMERALEAVVGTVRVASLEPGRDIP